MNQINICGCISAFTKQRGNVLVSQIFFNKINEITVTIKKNQEAIFESIHYLPDILKNFQTSLIFDMI